MHCTDTMLNKAAVDEPVPSCTIWYVVYPIVGVLTLPGGVGWHFAVPAARGLVESHCHGNGVAQ